MSNLQTMVIAKGWKATFASLRKCGVLVLVAAAAMAPTECGSQPPISPATATSTSSGAGGAGGQGASAGGAGVGGGIGGAGVGGIGGAGVGGAGGGVGGMPNGPGVAYFADFESPGCDGWILGGDWQCLTSTDPNFVFSGSQSLYADHYGYLWGMATSPPIDLSGLATANVEFKVSSTLTGHHGIDLRLTTTNSCNDAQKLPALAYSPLQIKSNQLGIQHAYHWGYDTSGWVTYSLELSAYAGATIRLCLSVIGNQNIPISDPSIRVVVDDVLVFGVPLSSSSSSGIGGGGTGGAGGTGGTGGTGGGGPSVTSVHEEFDQCPPAGWVLGAEWQCGVSAIFPHDNGETPGTLATNLNGTYGHQLNPTTAFAQTPLVNLAGMLAPRLQYIHAVDTPGGDGYNVTISTDYGASFQPLSILNETTKTVNGVELFDPGATNWRNPYSFDLSAYAGHEVLIRYEMRSNSAVVGRGVDIDHVRIYDAAYDPVEISEPSWFSFDDAYETELYEASSSTTNGGTGDGNWSISASSSNASWLTINATTGNLSGTPLAADVGPVSLTLRYQDAMNPNNFDEATFSFSALQRVYAPNWEQNCPDGWTLSGGMTCGNGGIGNVSLGGPGPGWTCYTTAVSPTINLSSTVSPKLLLVQEAYGSGFSLAMNVSANAGPAMPFFVLDNPSTGPSGVETVLDFSAYAGMQVVISFESCSYEASLTSPEYTYVRNLRVVD